MDWDNKKKKVGNIFEAIVFVGKQIECLVGAIGPLRSDIQALNNSNLDSVLSNIHHAINNLTTTLSSDLESHIQLTDEYGQPVKDESGMEKRPPHTFVDVLLQLSVSSQQTHEKIDALVDRMGNQFQNEVLAVLKKENAEQAVKIRDLEREIKRQLDRRDAERKAQEDGGSSPDQVEPVPGS